MDQNDALDLAKSICEEFCDTIIMDPENGSILLYVPKKFYAPICTRLAKLEFLEFFKQKKGKYIVVCLQFMFENEEDTEMYFEDDDDDDDIY